MGNLSRVRHTDDLQWVNSCRQRLADSRYGDSLFTPESSYISPIVRRAVERVCVIRIARLRFIGSIIPDNLFDWLVAAASAHTDWLSHSAVAVNSACDYTHQVGREESLT